jgi:hypothetical protein
MRTVNHTASHGSLLVEVGLLIRAAGVLAHVLEVHEAAKCVGMGLCLHHLEGQLVVLAVAVNRAGLDH